MSLVIALWVISLIAEFGVLTEVARGSWRKMYPRFFTYLTLDLSASLVLFWVAYHRVAFYDMLWRVIQVLLMAGRFSLVMEAYQSLVSRRDRWLFSDALAFPLAAFMVLVVREVISRPRVWPGFSLEGIFDMIGSGNAFLGFLLLGFLAAPRVTQKTENLMKSYHAKILCSYLLLTVPCYFAASSSMDSVGGALMIVAATCYSTWFLCMWHDRRMTNA